jgi:hypothetical protein
LLPIKSAVKRVTLLLLDLKPMVQVFSLKPSGSTSETDSFDNLEHISRLL